MQDFYILSIGFKREGITAIKAVDAPYRETAEGINSLHQGIPEPRFRDVLAGLSG